MVSINFEWDNQKSSVNKRKHGVSFEEVQAVFSDENAIEYFDPDHSIEEDRFIMLGMSLKLRVLVVCHCRRSRNRIRIISARKADKKEQKSYWRIME
jgi:hypothetical protein